MHLQGICWLHASEPLSRQTGNMGMGWADKCIVVAGWVYDGGRAMPGG